MDEAKVNELAQVLKEVLGCSPNLLFHAAQKVGAEASIQAIVEQLTPDVTPKQRKKTARIYLIALEIGRILMKTGDVELDDNDVSNMIAFMQLGSKK